MSRRFRDMGNFVWIAKAELGDDGNTLTINVCDQKKVTLNINSDIVKVDDLKK